MRKIMEQLLALQKLQFDARSRSSESKAEMEKLRENVPAPILAHYERLVSRGKKGVSIARNGVCSECHLRITGGKLVTLAHSDEVQLCDNCFRYLYLPADEPIGLNDPKSAPHVPVR
jgi:predicted  nucleic acid-binding Zn-ribbon protein